MLQAFKKEILNTLRAQDFTIIEEIQELWSGYGHILRIKIQSGTHKSIIIKHIRFPEQQNHPRGWNSETSHQRKIKSYEVELNWYRQFASKCNQGCRVAKSFLSISKTDEKLLLLEDLDASGFPVRKSKIELNEVKVVLNWLAQFHVRFLGSAPKGLWEVGTYWHLKTRPEEWQKMPDSKLKSMAAKMDSLLNQAEYQTLVHGDAKVANFCFSEDGEKVAAVDFQYIGGGCGIKDVAYFLGSCLNEEQCAFFESELLVYYFSCLQKALEGKEGTSINFAALEKEWRFLYPIAWTDFYRFLEGWMPGHWKINSYTEDLAKRAFVLLD